MATLYNDIYLRKNLDDKGVVPSSGGYYTSPDIIVSGDLPINNIRDYAKTKWAEDVGVDAVANATNYIYVRGKNLKTDKQNGEIALYYTKASLIMYPSIWINNQLKNSSGELLIPVSGEADEVIVTEDPFTWIPEMLNNDHFCLVAMVNTADHKMPTPTSDNMQDLATFLYNNPNVAWRNVTVVDNGVDFSTNVQYNQGDVGGKMYIFAECSACPDGAEISFSSGKPLADGSYINHEWTAINGCNPATKKHIIVGSTFDIPANWDSNIVYNYKSNGKSPLTGEDWGIKINVAFYQDSNSLTNELEALADTSDHAKAAAMNVHKTLMSLQGNEKLAATISPGKFIGIGSHSTIGKK